MIPSNKTPYANIKYIFQETCFFFYYLPSTQTLHSYLSSVVWECPGNTKHKKNTTINNNNYIKRQNEMKTLKVVKEQCLWVMLTGMSLALYSSHVSEHTCCASFL